MLVVMFGFISCTEPTMEESAYRAAQLTVQSEQYAMDGDLTNSSRLYEDAQNIINKYRGQDQFDEFYLIYNANIEDMLKTKYGINDQSAETVQPAAEDIMKDAPPVFVEEGEE